MLQVKNVKPSKNGHAIDAAVEASAGDESAWDEGVAVNPKTKPTSIRLSHRTIARAKYFAKIHHQRGYQSWLKNIIEERIETEYEVYKRMKKDIVG